MNPNMPNCHHRSLQAAAAAAIPACLLQPQPPPGPSPPPRPPPPLAAPLSPLVSGLGGVGDTARQMRPAAFACILPTQTYGCPVGGLWAPRVALIIKYPCFLRPTIHVPERGGAHTLQGRAIPEGGGGGTGPTRRSRLLPPTQGIGPGWRRDRVHVCCLPTHAGLLAHR